MNERLSIKIIQPSASRLKGDNNASFAVVSHASASTRAGERICHDT